MKDLTQRIMDDARVFPSFLDPGNAEHHRAMESIDQAFLWVAQLDEERFMSELEIRRCHDFVKMNIDKVLHILGFQIWVKSRDWLRYRLKVYIRLTERAEQFEQASNIKALFDRLYQKIPA
jgi:hypothetical protein